MRRRRKGPPPTPTTTGDGSCDQNGSLPPSIIFTPLGVRAGDGSQGVIARQGSGVTDHRLDPGSHVKNAETTRIGEGIVERSGTTLRHRGVDSLLAVVHGLSFRSQSGDNGATGQPPPVPVHSSEGRRVVDRGDLYTVTGVFLWGRNERSEEDRVTCLSYPQDLSPPQ